ncbi:MAG: tetratricopeptide repeat protein, partial [bacterium]|nr:tetratricopeptide repeat protein [bacterium]
QHPDTATSLNNVGMSYYESAQYGNAIEYLQQTLGLRTEILGADNTDTLGTLYNLTVCLVNLKRFKPAFDTLSKHLKDVPPDNPRYNELASLVSYIDSESIKSGFRAPSTQNASRGGGKKKKKKKKK